MRIWNGRGQRVFLRKPNRVSLEIALSSVHYLKLMPFRGCGFAFRSRVVRKVSRVKLAAVDKSVYKRFDGNWVPRLFVYHYLLISGFLFPDWICFPPIIALRVISIAVIPYPLLHLLVFVIFSFIWFDFPLFSSIFSSIFSLFLQLDTRRIQKQYIHVELVEHFFSHESHRTSPWTETVWRRK